jgi:thiosulfate/3-mercaptopyruvate sulfurtransferase
MRRMLPSTLFVTLFAAAAGAAVIPSAWKQAATPAASTLVTMEWLRQRTADPQVVVIAADRDRAAFERGHIPNARFVSHDATLDHQSHRLRPPADLAAAFAAAGATDTARIVVYGDDAMSVGWVFMALASLGHGDHTSVLDGNFAAWRGAGYPAATGPATPAKGTLSVKAATDVAVDRTWVRGHLEDRTTRLVDVRSPQEWSKGMLPNAGRLLWEDLYTNLGEGRFKQPAALRAMFEQAGVGKGQTAVTYCAVGMRASVAYLAARAAGIPVRVYVGSWADWSSDPASPIVVK